VRPRPSQTPEGAGSFRHLRLLTNLALTRIL
jgi:hypothetical protein